MTNKIFSSTQNTMLYTQGTTFCSITLYSGYTYKITMSNGNI